MNGNQSNRDKTEKRHLKQRLTEDVHVILSACLHQFDEGSYKEECFDVDAIMAGRLPEARQLKERHTGRTMTVDPSAFKPYETAITRGAFIPHQNLFNNILRAHGV